MTSQQMIKLIRAADPSGKKSVILQDAAANWKVEPLAVWNGRYSASRNETSLDLPLSEKEIKDGHREEDILTGRGVKKVVIISIDL